MSVLDLRNMDCMELMAQFPDKHFELAIVDPPYGIGMDGNNNWSGSKHQIKTIIAFVPNNPTRRIKRDLANKMICPPK